MQIYPTVTKKDNMLIFKNKGILLPVYVAVSTIAIAIVSGELKGKLEIEFEGDFGVHIIIGIGFIISGIWSYLTSEEFIKKDGVKIKVDIENSFFFISMKIWGYILISTGILFVIFGMTMNLTSPT